MVNLSTKNLLKRIRESLPELKTLREGRSKMKNSRKPSRLQIRNLSKRPPKILKLQA
jgi:hypothetical protein